uniref:Uncharacterized protein n=1 Tax=Palpitomonas bilix TaxID=652834 RepID=A0A7S3D057_9EUKA
MKDETHLIGKTRRNARTKDQKSANLPKNPRREKRASWTRGAFRSEKRKLIFVNSKHRRCACLRMFRLRVSRLQVFKSRQCLLGSTSPSSTLPFLCTFPSCPSPVLHRKIAARDWTTGLLAS